MLLRTFVKIQKGIDLKPHGRWISWCQDLRNDRKPTPGFHIFSHPRPKSIQHYTTNFAHHTCGILSLWSSLKDFKGLPGLAMESDCQHGLREFWAKERVRFPALLMGSAEDLIKGSLGINLSLRIFGYSSNATCFFGFLSWALQVDARCAREKTGSKWRVVKSLEANLLCRLWPSGCSFASVSFFFSAGCASVFLVKRSTVQHWLMLYIVPASLHYDRCPCQHFF